MPTTLKPDRSPRESHRTRTNTIAGASVGADNRETCQVFHWSCDGALVDRDFIREHFTSPQACRDLLYDYLRTRQLPEDVAKYLQSLDR